MFPIKTKSWDYMSQLLKIPVLFCLECQYQYQTDQSRQGLNIKDAPAYRERAKDSCNDDAAKKEDFYSISSEETPDQAGGKKTII